MCIAKRLYRDQTNRVMAVPSHYDFIASFSTADQFGKLSLGVGNGDAHDVFGPKYDEYWTKIGCPVKLSTSLDHRRGGTLTRASPSSTKVSPTEQVQASRTRLPFGISSITSTLAVTVSPILTGALKFSVCDR